MRSKFLAFAALSPGPRFLTDMNFAHSLRNIRWMNSAFLIGTLLTAIIGLPLFVYHYGGLINWWLHWGLFVGMFIAS